MSIRQCFGALVCSVLGFPAYAQQPGAEAWTAKLLENRRAQEQQINGILDALIADLKPEERKKVEGKVRARLGWMSPNSRIDCSVGNTALLRILPDRYEIWICEEGLRAISDAAASASFLEDGRRESWQRKRRVSEYFFKRYIYEVTQSTKGEGWAAVPCLPYQVAYLAATTSQDPIQCNRVAAHSSSDPDAVWALSALTGVTDRLSEAVPKALRPPSVIPTGPVDFHRGTVMMRDFLTEYLLLHELAHIVVPGAYLTESDLRGCMPSSIEAEMTADAFALDPKFGSMKLKANMMWWQATAWSYLDHVGVLNPATKCQLIKRDVGVRRTFCAPDRQLSDGTSKDSVDAWLEGLRAEMCKR